MRERVEDTAGTLWSRNLRTLGCYDSDSGSDLGSPSVHPPSAAQLSSAPAQFSDAHLIQELDLSARHDEALFKPNPWTIAKVNAAARPQPSVEKFPKSKVARTDKTRAQGRLAEAFRIQSQRKRTVSCTEPTTSSCTIKRSPEQSRGASRGPSDDQTEQPLAAAMDTGQDNMLDKPGFSGHHKPISYMLSIESSPSSNTPRMDPTPSSTHNKISLGQTEPRSRKSSAAALNSGFKMRQSPLGPSNEILR